MLVDLLPGFSAARLESFGGTLYERDGLSLAFTDAAIAALSESEAALSEVRRAVASAAERGVSGWREVRLRVLSDRVVASVE